MSPTPRPDATDPTTAADEAAQALTRARARGRRIAFVVYFAVAGAVAVGGAVQVFTQAFQRREAPELSVKTCAEGLARLSAALDRARTAGSLTDGEDAALADFRRALRPEWDDRDHIEDLCRSSAPSMAALDAIEQLRYAEEHAVRREAAELAPLRRRVQAIAPRDQGSPAADPPPPAPASPGNAGHTDPPNP